MKTENKQGLVPAPGASDAAKPAKLPVHSRAAAAQRLNDEPLQIKRGAYYPVPHKQYKPTGWRTKRYIKRKNLRRMNQQYAIVDRIGTRGTMLPMALGALIIMIVLAGVLVALTAIVEATQLRYQQDVTTLANILPGDSLKVYDMHGTTIYQMIDQGLQTTVPFSQISPNLEHAEIATEDQYFWSNPGYDITGIIRAAIEDLTNHRIVGGGSTITQQLIKNAIVGNQDTILRNDLCLEAMRLTYLLVENKYANHPNVNALLSLMCFHSSRFEARKNDNGEIVLYQDQDETRWNDELIAKGVYFLHQASQGEKISRYHVEANIAYWHTIKKDSAEKWENILQLYNHLLQIEYSPVAALNRTYALAKANGNAAAIAEAEKLNLTDNHFYYTLLGELYKDTDNNKAKQHFEKAMILAKTNTDRQTIRKKLDQLSASHKKVY